MVPIEGTYKVGIRAHVMAVMMVANKASQKAITIRLYRILLWVSLIRDQLHGPRQVLFSGSNTRGELQAEHGKHQGSR